MKVLETEPFVYLLNSPLESHVEPAITGNEFPTLLAKLGDRLIEIAHLHFTLPCGCEVVHLF